MNRPHKISWLNMPGYKGESLNVVSGCTPASYGCDFCYAREMISRFAGMKGWPKSPDHVTMFPKRIYQMNRWKKPRVVFIPSMGDLFHMFVPWNFQYKVFEMMMLNPQHIFIILTKRAKKMRHNVDSIYFHLKRNYPDVEIPMRHVWLGVSVENQELADIRIPSLIETKAAKKIVSAEPLLGPIDFKKVPGFNSMSLSLWNWWVLVGCESSQKARPMKEEWARSIIKQCSIARVPVFYKQAMVDGKLVSTPAMDGKQYTEFPI